MACLSCLLVSLLGYLSWPFFLPLLAMRWLKLWCQAKKEREEEGERDRQILSFHRELTKVLALPFPSILLLLLHELGLLASLIWLI